MAAQNARTRAVLDALPSRPALHRRLLALLQAGTSGSPAVAGDAVFALERVGEAEQARLVAYAADGSSAPAVVVDPAALSGDPTTAVDWYHPSPDGRLVAWGMSEAGSERSTLRVVDVATGRLLGDEIPHTRAASVAWLPDGSAFAYTRYPAGSELGRRVWWHRLGDDPGRDALVFGEDLDDETAWPDVSLSPDGRWLAVHVSFGWTRTDVHLLDRRHDRWQVVVAGEEAVTSVQVVGDRLYAVTNLDAPRGRVVTAPAESPGPPAWEDVVPEGEAVVEGAVVAGRSLLVLSTEHAVSRLRRHALDGPGGDGEEVPLPELGSVTGLDADPAHERAFLTFTSFTRPPGLWRWTPAAGLEPWSRFPLPVDPGRYSVEQHFYPSTDGTRVPIFLVGPADATASPDTPTVLTGYGGFAISMSPAFGPGTVAWADAGGVSAVACLRGGGEYGEEWHRAGMGAGKAQVFDDFCAAADWLVAEGRTSRERLAVRGGSNGGLLVGAAITRRPDLCRAAVCAVPLLDMLRFHRFLIGALWVHEYGDPDRPEDFDWLASYSPYHHVVDGTVYPATLFLTAEGDSRVDPLHARKMAARLQAAQPPEVAAERPVLLRVEPRAGHGVGKPTSKQAHELADTWAFVRWQLGLGA